MATDEELFAEATTDKPETQDEDPEQQGQPGQAEAHETQDNPQEDDLPIAEAMKQQKEEHRVPLMELLNEREKRQNFERQIEDERRQREALERRIAEFQRQQQPQQQTPDIFENPQGFVETIEQRFDRKLREQEGEFSMRLAKRQYKEEFDAAYQSLLREGQSNPATVQAIVNQSDPGEAMMQWHRQRSLMEKVGGDLDGYMKKREEDLLKDPEFRKRFAEILKTEQSSSNQNQRPASVVQIPPSLSKASSAPPVSASDDDVSDEALFRHATRR